MNASLLVPVLGCLGGLLIASGCSQGPWSWGKPGPGSTADGVAAPAGGPSAIAGGAKADAKTPKNPLALARLTERQGRTEQAERMYQDILKKSPKNPVPYHRLGVMYARQGKLKQAEEHFSRALALKPDAPELLSDAGYFYYLTGRAQEAEGLLRRALEMEPGNRKYCTNLALAVGEQGRRDEAYALFRRAGSETQATANMAFVLSQRGEYEEALELYDRVLTDDPSMRVAADAMIELSKRATRRKSGGPAAAPGEGRRMLGGDLRSTADFGDSSPATAAEGAAASSANPSLVTIGAGRPVSRSSTPNRFSATAAQEVLPSSAGLPPSRGLAGAAPAAGVPCAYAVPSDVAALRPDETPTTPHPGLVPAPSSSSRMAAPGFPNSSKACEIRDPSGSVFPSGADSASQGPAQVLPRPRPSQAADPLLVAMIGGMALLGLGAIGWFRRGPRWRSSATPRGSARSGHRHEPVAASDRWAGTRIRRARIWLRRRRA